MSDKAITITPRFGVSAEDIRKFLTGLFQQPGQADGNPLINATLTLAPIPSESRKTITKKQFYTLLGLHTLVGQYDRALKDIEKAVADIIGEKENEYGYHDAANAFIYQEESVADMLRRQDIAVSD